MIKIAFRVDASLDIGTGHVKRCLSLANALQEQGAQVSFVSRSLDRVSTQSLGAAPCTVHWLPRSQILGSPPNDSEAPPHAAWAGVSWTQDARETTDVLYAEPPDWLVVDHYAFDVHWHEALRKTLGCRLLVIDDIGDRYLAPDVLLDHNWATDHYAKYASRLSRETHWLTGPRFALLSPGYRTSPRYRFHTAVRSIGIFMGGTDPGGISVRLLVACREAGFKGTIELVSTSANPHLNALRESCSDDPSSILTLDEPDLAAFFSRHDLQIGAGGSASWERCCVGPPAIAIAVVTNQLTVVPGLASLGAVRLATEGTLPAVLCELLDDPAQRQALATQAAKLVDGRGAQRVALHLLHDTLRLRPATLADASLLHLWRNHPSVRAVSVNPGDIAIADHQRWMQRVLTSPDRWLFVAQVGALPIGSVRFDLLEAARFEVSIYTDPQLQGLGIGSRLLVAGERLMHDNLRTPFIVIAKVAPGNTASKNLFEACGYHGGPLYFCKTIGLTPSEQRPCYEDS